MTAKKSKQSRSKYNEHFEQIKAPPEKVAEAIMKSPPKDKDEWRYKKK